MLRPVCAVNSRIPLAVYGVLSDRLYDPSVWCHGLATKQHFVISIGVQKTRVHGILRPAVDDEIKSAPRLRWPESYKVITRQMLSEQRGQSGLAERDKLLRGHPRGFRSSKAGIIGRQDRSKAPAQEGPIALVQGAAEFVDCRNHVLGIGRIHCAFALERALERATDQVCDQDFFSSKCSCSGIP